MGQNLQVIGGNRVVAIQPSIALDCHGSLASSAVANKDTFTGDLATDTVKGFLRFGLPGHLQALDLCCFEFGDRQLGGKAW